METGILERVQKEIEQYGKDHRGERPLFILISPYEADALMDEVRQNSGYDADTLVTTYKDCKIVKYDSLHKGELLLTNELPETSS